MRLTFLTALATLLADQILKWVVVVGLNLRETLQLDVWPPFLTLTMAWNRGVNFGLFADDSAALRWVLIALPVAVSAWVWRWVRHEGARPLLQVAAGFLIGGALGNAIDRVIWGAVADFLNVSCCGFHNPWAFNVADIAI
ncbi:MAG: signal peptidase II, partial [Rhodobacteraceae bacterium]|nr:signal peptidase II [Paracoccaceae bacterium]